ncbi:AbrB/MazE/SpoVT family DNA-binding domain-containing protein [Ethanoligenens harbinense]|uniref:SpoVT/AbrB domain-containing protein n=1 Tax=Ethanoligenens harbinense (strain DSM 18485 / JCM 12961 / CGMCC 1.5033 / YUAN-3) TaxID=663278 RepID=E6U930_ETHHY|nr:AbrB/MazE/SpoVT family DNA-binding domain-containing protein [Ethanoligenens harbinense]ADU26094.1 SpoVT/AbrB domain-containing protein [Ethanoligenens harbinense YUAN-3]
MTVSKRLGGKGGLTIPQAVRHAAGLAPGAPIDIEDAGDGILIRKHVPSCIFCGGTTEVVTVAGKEICLACARELAALAAEKLEDFCA